MNQNPPPRRPQPPRQGQPQRRTPTQQRPTNTSGLGQPVRRTHVPNGGPRPAPRPPQNPSRPLIHPARTARRRRQRAVVLSILVVVILLVCMLIGLIFSELATAIGIMVDRTGTNKKDDPAKVTTTAAPDPDDPTPSGSETTAPPAGMKMTSVQKKKDDVAVGNLLLINAENAYVFPTYASGLANIFDNRPYVTLDDGSKVRVYKVRNGSQALDSTALQSLNNMIKAFYEQYKTTDMLVTWAHRTLPEQQDLYNLYVADYPGYSDAQIKQLLRSQVDTPGYSEHHLGTSVDLKLYSDSGVTYTLDDEPGYFAWLKQNCWKYGYILRYPTEKAEVTGISYDPYHFRYVEIPHAYYISSNGLCFEEYLEQLRNTTSPDGQHLTFTVDGGATYEVYYVKSAGNTTDIPVPADYPYTVSGDNMNGFIVTVTVD